MQARVQVPVAKTVARAWGSLILAIRRMPALFLGAIVTAILLACVQIMATAEIIIAIGANPSWQIPYTLLGFPPRTIIMGVIEVVARSLVAAPVAVAVHRFVLLNETTRDIRSLWEARTGNFFLWLVGVQFAYALMGWLMGALAYNSVGWFSSALIFYLAEGLLLLIAEMLVAVCVAMLFPAIAIDAPVSRTRTRLGVSIRQMQGNFWRFVAVDLLTFAPFYVITRLAVLVTPHVAAYSVPMTGSGRANLLAMPQFSNIWYLGSSAFQAILFVLLTAILAALASWFYAAVTGAMDLRSADSVPA